MSIPDKEMFESEKPSVLSNWAFEQEYETSFKIVNEDTGEHIQAMINEQQEQLRLVPMVSQGAGYSSVQSEGETYYIEQHEKIVNGAWSLARRIRNGDIGRDESDFTL